MCSVSDTIATAESESVRSAVLCCVCIVHLSFISSAMGPRAVAYQSRVRRRLGDLCQKLHYINDTLRRRRISQSGRGGNGALYLATLSPDAHNYSVLVSLLLYS